MSASADWARGYDVYFGGKWIEDGGTSAAAPLWGGDHRGHRVARFLGRTRGPAEPASVLAAAQRVHRHRVGRQRLPRQQRRQVARPPRALTWRPSSAPGRHRARPGMWDATEAPGCARPTPTCPPWLASNSVACASTTSCVAAGTYYDHADATVGLLLTGAGSSWRAVQAPLPANAAADPQVDLTAVTCTPSSYCVAIGTYTDTAGAAQGVLLTRAGSSWTTAKMPCRQAPRPTRRWSLPASLAPPPGNASPRGPSMASTGMRKDAGQRGRPGVAGREGPAAPDVSHRRGRSAKRRLPVRLTVRRRRPLLRNPRDLRVRPDRDRHGDILEGPGGLPGDRTVVRRLPDRLHVRGGRRRNQHGGGGHAPGDLMEGCHHAMADRCQQRLG